MDGVQRDEPDEKRRAEVDRVAAEFAGIYPEGYRTELRAEWPDQTAERDGRIR